MTLDPNWFYSSLAQSAAAVIGVIGGFVISSLLRQREELSVHRATLLKIAAEVVRAQQNVFKPRADWRDWWTKTKEEIEATRSSTSALIPTLGLSGTKGPINVTATAAEIALLDEAHEQCSRLVEALKRDALGRFFLRPDKSDDLLRTLITVSADEWRIRQQWRPQNGWLSRVLDDEDGELARLIRSVSDYRDAHARAERGFAPRYYYFLVALLAWISAAGVLYPLLRLSAHADIEKWILAALFGVGLVGVLGFVIVLVRDVRRIIRIESVDVIRAGGFLPEARQGALG